MVLIIEKVIENIEFIYNWVLDISLGVLGVYWFGMGIIYYWFGMGIIYFVLV